MAIEGLFADISNNKGSGFVLWQLNSSQRGKMWSRAAYLILSLEVYCFVRAPEFLGEMAKNDFFACLTGTLSKLVNNAT